MKTLYVSDLDGTLLRSDQRTSEYTNRVINELVAKGMLFSYATARSYSTSHKVTAGMTAPFPIIIYNGAFVRDNASGQMLLENFYEKEAVAPLVRDLTEHGITPIVYGFVDGIERFSYNIDTVEGGAKDFIDTRHGDSRDRQVMPQRLIWGAGRQRVPYLNNRKVSRTTGRWHGNAFFHRRLGSPGCPLIANINR